MNFLLHLTSSILTISQSLPPPPDSSSPNQNPLQLSLLPSLINAFHIFITRLSDQVNSRGRILSQSTINSWFEELDQLVQGTKGSDALGQERKALEGVQGRLRREVGWLVGWKETEEGGQGGMEGVEEEL